MAACNRSAGSLSGATIPTSKQQADVTQKLAVAYMKAGQSGAAAAEFERIADNKAQPPAVRLEALTIAADQYERAATRRRRSR